MFAHCYFRIPREALDVSYQQWDVKLRDKCVLPLPHSVFNLVASRLVFEKSHIQSCIFFASVASAVHTDR